MKNVKSETGFPLVSFYNPLGKKTPPAQNTGTMKNCWEGVMSVTA